MLEFVDIGFYTLCIVGLGASLALSVWGLLIIPNPLPDLPSILGKLIIVAILPIGILFVIRYQQLTRNVKPRLVGKMLYQGCPGWMKSMCYFCMLVGVIFFFLPMVLELVGAIPRNNGEFLPGTFPGGAGLLAYSALPAQLYSLKTLKQ
jgi:hypothetical protein